MLMSYLLKVLYLLMFWLTVMLTYYYAFPFHQSSFDWGYAGYVGIIGILYVCYKWYNAFFAEEKIRLTPVGLFGFSLLHLLILSVVFFTIQWQPWFLWMSLFFKILWYLFLPILFIFVLSGLWRKILWYIDGWKEESGVFQMLSATAVWFASFITFLTFFGWIGFYNLFVVFWLLLWAWLFAYKEIGWMLQQFISYKIELPNHQSGKWLYEFLQFRVLTAEFFFLVITFLISINLINATRPMPIGWDDLWVYMNYPQLMAQAWDILSLGWMYAWQVFTGIGYMFQSPTQAFFLNNIGWILAVLVIILSFIDLLKSRSQTLIHIPLLAGMMFLSMPMIIFQQAKDMKIDPGLFFISATVIYMVLYLFVKYLGYREVIKTPSGEVIQETSPESASLEVNVENNQKNSFLQYFSKYEHIWIQDMFTQKKNLMYLLIIWFLAGFAFTLKFTSLLLISALIWVFFYAKIGIAWLFAYFAIYVWIFTKAWLWSMMNVVFPKDDVNLINMVFGGSFVLFAILLGYAWNKYGLKSLQRLGVIVWIFLVWVGAGVSPWIVKNISESKTLGISSMLFWKPVYFQAEYEKFLSPEEKQQIDDTYLAQERINESGTTWNEDLWRYFWYEKWVNNYLKLPYNLSMQSNQRGEFTEITYWYLALIPVVLLFLSYKYAALNIWVFVFSLFTFLFFLIWPLHSGMVFLGMSGLPEFLVGIQPFFTEIFSKFQLPWWYAIIVLFFIVPFLYIMYALQRDKMWVLFKLNAVFAVFYIFLWSISAYGIVWYGIAMYYSLLLIIAIWIHCITLYDEKAEWKIKVFTALGTFTVLFIILSYTFQSTFPQGMNNIKNAWYTTFKAGMSDTYSSIFDAQMKYYDALVELNISEEKRDELFLYVISNIKNQRLSEIIQNNVKNNFTDLNNVLAQLANTPLESWNIEHNAVIQESKRIRTLLYKNILYPKDEFQNDTNIYRIGTFMRYFVVNNYKRMYEDSLIFEFQKYFYDENNLDISLERMRDIWVGYFLVDLNAATIDRDPRRALTQRFESLLKTFTSDKIELVSTDSMCLQTALESYNNSSKTSEDMQNYITLAWVNYESYDSEGNLTLNRNQKLLACYNTILKLIEEDQISETSYVHLLPIKNYLEQNPAENIEELSQFFSQYVTHGWQVLFKIKQ